MPIERSHIYQLKVTLLGTRPPIWRRLLVPSYLTLGELHHVIQAAMGWSDNHMHMFRTKQGVVYGNLVHDQDKMLDFKDERKTSIAKVLRKPKKSVMYEYDFGDDWEHEVLLEKQFPLIGETAPHPECVKAVGACPPEDVGGVFGYQEFVKAISNPDHPEHADIADWWGAPSFDPAAVDIELINERLRNPQPDEPEPYPFGDSVEGPLSQLGEKFHQHVGGREFNSEEELRSAFDEFMLEQEREPVDDFHGLTPDQMHKLLYSTFSAPDLVEWNFDAANANNSMASRVVSAMLEKLQTKKLKLTAKGNLPLAAVRELLAASLADNDAYQADALQSLRSEEDVLSLHIPRLLAEITGLTVASRSSLALSEDGRKMLAANAWHEVYRRLLFSILNEFNWAYLGGIDEIPSLQMTAPFSLWLLHRFGGEWRNSNFYTEQLSRAFPHFNEEVAPNAYLSAGEILDIVVKIRLFLILNMFGLVEERLVPSSIEGGPSNVETEVRATPLFRELLQWKI